MMLEDFLSWYLAPWRRMARRPFNIAVGVITSVGLVFSMMGFVDSMGGALAPVSGMQDLLGGLSAGGGSVGEAMNYANQIQQFAGNEPSHQVAEAGWSIPWSGILNNVLLLVMIPLVRMRLHDMGKFGTHEWVWLGLAYGSVVTSILGGVGIGLGMLGYGVGGVSFIVWLWLCVAPTKRRDEEEKASLYERVHGVRPYDGRDGRYERPNERRMTEGARPDMERGDDNDKPEIVSRHDPYR